MKNKEMLQMAEQLKVLTERVDTMENENKQALAEAKKNPKGFKRKTFLYYGLKGPAEVVVGAGTLVSSLVTCNPLGIIAGGVSLAAGINSTVKFFKNLKAISEAKQANLQSSVPIIKADKKLKNHAMPDAGLIFGEEYANIPQDEKAHVDKLMDSRVKTADTRTANPPLKRFGLQRVKA